MFFSVPYFVSLIVPVSAPRRQRQMCIRDSTHTHTPKVQWKMKQVFLVFRARLTTAYIIGNNQRFAVVVSLAVAD